MRSALLMINDKGIKAIGIAHFIRNNKNVLFDI